MQTLKAVMDSFRHSGGGRGGGRGTDLAQHEGTQNECLGPPRLCRANTRVLGHHACLGLPRQAWAYRVGAIP